MRIDLQAIELPIHTTQINGVHADYINDSTNDDRFEVTLSVSTRTVETKEEAKKVLDFTQHTFVASHDSDELASLFQTRLYSTNTWSVGCNNEAYVGMTGVTLDFDHGFTIGEAQEAFAEWNYILHTSRTHGHSEDGMPADDRFRVILPFAPSGLYYTSGSDARKVYNKLMGLYPQADKSCRNPGRKFFPSTRELKTPFVLDVNVTGNYYSIDISNMPDDDDVKGSAAKPYKWDGKLRPKSGLLKVLANCPFVKWVSDHIGDPSYHIREPLKYALITNLARFHGGREAIHGILKRDWRKNKYNEGVVDSKITNALQNGGPQRYATIRELGWEGEVPDWPASPAGWAYYVDLDGVLSELKSVKGKKRMEALRIHFIEDFHLLAYQRAADWLTKLSQELQLGKEVLERMACDAISNADLEDRDLKDVLKGALGLGASPEDRGRIIYRWFISNGGLVYRDREHRGYWIWEGTVYELGNNQPFHTFVWRITGLTHEGIESRKIWAALKAETDTQGTYLNSFSWIHTDGNKNTIHVHLNSDVERILRINPAGVSLVENGSNSDSILLAPAPKMSPVTLVPLDSTGYSDALLEFDSLVLRNLATTRNNQLLVGCWAMTYPLMDYVKTLPHLRFDGVSSSGKTRGMELISQFIYGDNHLKKATEAANYTDGARNPLVLLDNVEVANFNQGLGDFVLTAATGITKEKRVIGTDRDTVLEKVHCLVATNGIENLGKTEHINRTLAIKFDRWMHPSPHWSERVYTRIAAARPQMVSAHMLLVSRVLSKIANGRLEWWQDYLERKHPGHAKDRSNSFISLMALILEELLPVIEPTLQVEAVVSDWVKVQNQQGKEVAVESNQIIGYLDAILEDASFRPLVVEEAFRNWGYEVKVIGRKVIGTASQLHHTFGAVARRKGLKYEYKDARQLAMRIADTAKTLAVGEATDGVVLTRQFSLKTEKDRTKTTIYTFDFDGGKPDDSDAGDE
jgi:hypothetical protein